MQYKNNELYISIYYSAMLKTLNLLFFGIGEIMQSAQPGPQKLGRLGTVGRDCPATLPSDKLTILVVPGRVACLVS